MTNIIFLKVYLNHYSSYTSLFNSFEHKGTILVLNISKIVIQQLYRISYLFVKLKRYALNFQIGS